MKPGSLFVGLMSGTSMDGVDAAVVRFDDDHCELIATFSQPYPATLTDALYSATSRPQDFAIDTIGHIDCRIAESFVHATRALLDSAGLEPSDILAIGSHGQTVRHQPRAKLPFTVQLGDPNIIAARTGITTVADFRRRDMAVGGEGAPLAPAFHQWLLRDRDAVIVNLGGIANITVPDSKGGQVLGYDTGPANTLLDAWTRSKKGKPYDDEGKWARSGRVQNSLLAALLQDPYLELPPPKSTGLEYFNLDWLNSRIKTSNVAANISDQDVQATLTEFTATSVVNAIKDSAPDAREVLACGGGYRNLFLMERISSLAAPMRVSSTAEIGIPPDWMEAAAFAWLARQTLNHLPGNLPSVTGASQSTILGGIFLSNA